MSAASDDGTRATLMLVVTRRCNLHCVYCYERRRGEASMPTHVAQDAVRRHLSTGSYQDLAITFFGGEPLLAFETIRTVCEWTWRQSWDKTYGFSVSTNGTILTDTIRSWLRSNRNRISVALSLDGTKESHDSNRSRSYDLIDVDFFRDTWPELSVKMTVSRQSLGNLSRDVMHVHSLGLGIRECNLAAGIDWSGQHQAAILARELGILCRFYLDHPALEPAPIANMKIGSCENRRAYLRWCGVGRQLMTVDTDGQQYPCHLLTPMAFPERDLRVLLDTDFSDIRRMVDKDCLEHCYIYPVCPSCYAADYLLTGQTGRRDHSICKLMQIRAYYSALLRAKQLLKTEESDTQVGDLEQRARTYKEIKAIKRIHELFDPGSL